ncbi:GtrA family protein [Marinomonas sp. THO17]|uniref:GtrA family protein n=1 Tax=Marinomonas sp. THO17 TaxID=3149048 RepID=UPI00336C2A98
MKQILKHPLLRFALVGGIGFLVDMSSFALLSHWLDYAVARGLAFWIATSSNWWWNRHFTFAQQNKAAIVEWLQFLGGSIVAFVPNMICYVILNQLDAMQHLAFGHYIALVPGVLLGMMINYSLSRYWIFSSPPA